MLVTDLALARRLEMADAAGSQAFIQARQKLSPNGNASFWPVAGGCAFFDGVDSPLTQGIGLGMNGPVTESEMEELENFYRSRGVPTSLEVCPMIDSTLLALLKKREYRVIEFSNVLVCWLKSRDIEPVSNFRVHTHVVSTEEIASWTRTVAKGFSEGTETSFPPELFEPMAYGATSTCFLAEIDGQVVGGGAMAIHQGIVMLFAGCTLTQFRSCGVQTALLQARLNLASTTGCDLAMVITAPGSTSQRNAERQGFRVVYTRTKLVREL